jgi:hypothetical protein
MTRTSKALMGLGLAAVLSGAAGAQDFKKGDPGIKSAGALAFGPDGTLFVGDSKGGVIHAFQTGDKAGPKAGKVEVEGLNEALAGMLGTESREILINDIAVNPATSNIYLSAERGRGPEPQPVICRIDPSGKVVALELEELPHAKAELPALPDASATDERGRSPRAQAITDIGFADGRVLVAGLSNEEFSSRLLAIPFPFTSSGESASVEIYHGAHGRFETRSPVRTFLACKVGGEPCILAAYTCTPLVKIPVAQLKAGEHVKGTTIAELGNRNTPLDMIAYQKGGAEYVLMANTSRGLMKIPMAGAEKAEGITTPIADTAGLGFETVEALKGLVVQLDKLDDTHAVVVVQAEDGQIDLKMIELP